MFIIKTILEGELRKDNGDFNIRSEYDTTYIKEENIHAVIKEVFDIASDSYWELPEFDDKEGEYGFYDVYENLYPDIEVYWVDDNLWNVFEQLDITPVMKNEWMIAGFCISGFIEDNIKIEPGCFADDLMLNDIKKWEKDFKGNSSYNNLTYNKLI